MLGQVPADLYRDVARAMAKADPGWLGSVEGDVELLQLDDGRLALTLGGCTFCWRDDEHLVEATANGTRTRVNAHDGRVVEQVAHTGSQPDLNQRGSLEHRRQAVENVTRNEAENATQRVSNGVSPVDRRADGDAQVHIQVNRWVAGQNPNPGNLCAVFYRPRCNRQDVDNLDSSGSCDFGLGGDRNGGHCRKYPVFVDVRQIAQDNKGMIWTRLDSVVRLQCLSECRPVHERRRSRAAFPADDPDQPGRRPCRWYRSSNCGGTWRHPARGEPAGATRR